MIRFTLQKQAILLGGFAAAFPLGLQVPSERVVGCEIRRIEGDGVLHLQFEQDVLL